MVMEGLGTAEVTDNAYQYNGKEWNEDLGLNWHDYGARWYDAALGRWWAVDPLGEKYGAWSPYNQVLGNPVRFIDPTGMSVETEIFNQKGKKVGEDSNRKDGKISIVTNDIGKKVKKGEMEADAAISTGINTSYSELVETESVLKRTEKNGGNLEEVSVVQSDGVVIEGVTGAEKTSGGLSTVEVPPSIGTNNTLIHSHPINASFDGTYILSDSALEPGPADPGVFKGYKSNIIVGRLGSATGSINADGSANITQPRLGAVFYDRNSNFIGSVTRSAIKKIISKR